VLGLVVQCSVVKCSIVLVLVVYSSIVYVCMFVFVSVSHICSNQFGVCIVMYIFITVYLCIFTACVFMHVCIFTACVFMHVCIFTTCVFICSIAGL
jgi:hypothetical protein